MMKFLGSYAHRTCSKCLCHEYAPDSRMTEHWSWEAWISDLVNGNYVLLQHQKISAYWTHVMRQNLRNLVRLKFCSIKYMIQTLYISLQYDLFWAIDRFSNKCAFEKFGKRNVLVYYQPLAARLKYRYGYEIGLHTER